MLRRPPPMTTPLKPQNAQKYCEFYEQNGYTTTECRELKKALHELPDKGQIDHFLKRGPRFLCREQEPAQPQPRDEEFSMEVVATIAGDYAEVPTMEFGRKEAPCFASPHNDPLVMEMKIASVIVRRILIDTGSSIDIITWDCLKKLTHPGRDIVPLEVNLTGMFCLPIRFGDKLKAKNLEVDFLVVNMPTAYNVILGRPTLHKAKACKYNLKKKKKIKKMKKKEQGKRGGCLIPCTITLTERRNKLHLLVVSALILGPLALHLVANPSSLRHSTAALTPRVNASAVVTSSSIILGGSEVPEVAKSQDLTKSCISENLATRSALIKRSRENPDGLRSSPHDLRGGSVLLGTRGANAAVSSGQPSVRWRLRTGKLIVGFFLRGARGGACSQNSLSVYPKLGVMMKGGKQGSKLIGLLVHKALPLLFPTALGPGSHLPRSGIPGLKDYQPHPHLLCIKQKGSKNQTERLTNTGTTNTLRKIFKDQKARRAVGSPKGFLTGLPSFQSGTSPQLDSRWTKRKSYFQYFTFDFFSMAIMNPGLPRSLWEPSRRYMKRESETVVGSSAINCYTFGSRLIHSRIRLRDYKCVPCWHEWAGAPGNANPSATILRTSPTGERPCLLSTDFPKVEGPSWDEEFVDALSEDECLDDLSEEEEEVLPEIELVLVEATSAPGFDELGEEQGLPCMPLANNSFGDLTRGVDLSAMVISHGCETSTSGLRMLGVEKYSQLDHEGVPGLKRGIA
ncbi:LOW QUALITY PROTEIN: hypothetical protein Cgig2_033855 [Carnegiea gigantea]|uniref:Uncharacterized protein n=1 Tax=Carnegiea gigantea TaxID=171969 RepID=A0A9Q1JJZ1_9CARY|nr:LOW QUALITY PROTEIN: hypothetical protein Cgig2_033855 [Carnegiea gigantea]